MIAAAVPIAMPTRRMVRKNMIAPIAREIMRTIYVRDIPLGICYRVTPRGLVRERATIVSRVTIRVRRAIRCEGSHRRGLISGRRRGVSNRCMATAEMRAANMSTAKPRAATAESVRLRL